METGVSMETFKNMVGGLAGATHHEAINTGNMEIISLIAEDRDNYILYPLSGNTVDEFELKGSLRYRCTIKKDAIPDRKLFEEDVINGCGFLVRIKNEAYLVSRLALNTLFRRAGATGSRVTKKGLGRDIYVVGGLVEEGDRVYPGPNMTIIYRELKGVKKIFFCPTEKYRPCPQDILKDAACRWHDVDGKRACTGTPDISWLASHQQTEIHFRYPDDAVRNLAACGVPFIPGIIFRTSETGEYSHGCLATLTLDSATIVTGSATKKHGITAEDPDVAEKKKAVRQRAISEAADNGLKGKEAYAYADRKVRLYVKHHKDELDRISASSFHERKTEEFIQLGLDAAEANTRFINSLGTVAGVRLTASRAAELALYALKRLELGSILYQKRLAECMETLKAMAGEKANASRDGKIAVKDVVVLLAGIPAMYDLPREQADDLAEALGSLMVAVSEFLAPAGGKGSTAAIHPTAGIREAV